MIPVFDAHYRILTPNPYLFYVSNLSFDYQTAFAQALNQVLGTDFEPTDFGLSFQDQRLYFLPLSRKVKQAQHQLLNLPCTGQPPTFWLCSDTPIPVYFYHPVLDLCPKPLSLELVHLPPVDQNPKPLYAIVEPFDCSGPQQNWVIGTHLYATEAEAKYFFLKHHISGFTPLYLVLLSNYTQGELVWVAPLSMAPDRPKASAKALNLWSEVYWHAQHHYQITYATPDCRGGIGARKNLSLIPHPYLAEYLAKKAKKESS
jgi:hypothetical protein